MGYAARRDAAMISAAQRVEHYEMAGYGAVRTYAELLGQKEIQQLLQATLDEEGMPAWVAPIFPQSKPFAFPASSFCLIPCPCPSPDLYVALSSPRPVK